MTDARHLVQTFAWAVNLSVLGYFITLNGLYLCLLICSLVWCRRYKRRTVAHPVDFDALPYLRSLVPPVSILMPAYNEEQVIVQSVRSMLGIGYASIEVVVINDGSSDQTLDELERAFSLRKSEARASSEINTAPIRDVYVSTVEPRLIVVDKQNGGKADALNAGINFSQSPYFLAVDADSLLEPEALRLALRVIFEDPERRVAVGGIVRGVNGSIVDGGRIRQARLLLNFWVMMQAIEYVRSFLAGRAGWSLMKGLLVVPGAFGLFQRAACVRAGGYSTATVTEDLELVVRLHRFSREHGLGWQVVFAPDAVCWTEMPDNAGVLSRQRRRWHEGLWQTLTLHRSMLFRPRYGVVGMLSLPHQALHELGGPLLELAGVILLPVFYAAGLLSYRAFVLYLALAFFSGLLFSLASFLMDETHFPRHRYPRDALLLMAFSAIEYFGYRQVFMAWRLAATWNYFFGRISWRVSSRSGYTTKAP
jgi:cellulose synthase/poly-beta-1,6-N-acetylglucosamine synthase-like glycosyltransferase